MKIVKNYKGLKKWAKTLFIALLTICIVFTTTGVGTLFVYAEPNDHNYERTGYGSYDGDDQHEAYYRCTDCDAEKTELEPCSYTQYAPLDDTQHYLVCEYCHATKAEPHTYVDGVCACGAVDPDANSDPASDPNANGQLTSGPLGSGAGTNDPLNTPPDPKSLTDSDVTIEVTSVDPLAQTITGTFTAGSQTLVAGTDFTVTYPTYVEIGQPVSVTITGIGDYKDSVTAQGSLTVSSIPLQYDGANSPASSYPEKVVITPFDSSVYQIGLSASGLFSSKVTYTTPGEGQEVPVYLQHKNSGVVIKVTTAPITIASSTVSGSSTGRITVGEYSSDKLARTADTVYTTGDRKEIKITAQNDAEGVKTIEYAWSSEPYYSVSDIEGAVVDGDIRWKLYNASSKPTIPMNAAKYIYARITDFNGAYTYLSTGKIIHDTIKPTVTSVTVLAKDNGKDSVAAMLGKDTLSGIDRFYIKYEPKSKDAKTPSAQEVIDAGKYADVETREGDKAAASFTTDELLSDITYYVYVVARDKAGNISDVKRIETKGKGKSSDEVSGNDAKGTADSIAGGSGSGSGSGAGAGGAGGSGLTPAPNGIAGSGNVKQPVYKDESTSQSTAAQSPLDREINRTPYISDATGDTKIGLPATGGWDKITEEVKEAEDGTSIDVEMSGLSVVPDRLLGAMRGRDVSVRFRLPQDIEWLINGEDIETTSGADIDMGVVIGARNIPLDMLDAVTGTYPHTEIELKHDGPLGFKGKLRVPLGESNSGMYAYLYYYDTEAQEMVLKQSARVTSAGIAEFDFDHASDYTIVVRAEEMLAAAPADETPAVTEAEEITDVSDAAYTTFTMDDAVGNRASVRIWLFMVAVISALLCGAILFMPGLQRPEGA